MNCDHGPCPYVANIEQITAENTNFRTAVWTGCNLQMTRMCIPPCGEIGLEIHEDTDQFIQVVRGRAVVKMGNCKNQLDFRKIMCRGDGVFIPAGTWHNIINTGGGPLKIFSIYVPPRHPRGTVQKTKMDAEMEEY
ncbi:MAG: cupin domain-containing protein [Blautia sp.]